MWIFWGMYVFFSGKYHIVTQSPGICLSRETSNELSKVVGLFYTPTGNICVPVVHHQHLCLRVFWIWAIIIGVRKCLIVGSKLHFLDDYLYWTHFHELTAICILSFTKFLVYLFGTVGLIIYLEISFLYSGYKCIYLVIYIYVKI